MSDLELFENARRITYAGRAQRQVFDLWARKNHKDNLYDCMAFDTETTGLVFGEPSIYRHNNSDYRVSNITPFGISMCFPVEDRLNLVWARAGSNLYERCEELIRVKGPKVMHNARYDLRVCAVNDMEIAGPIFDTLTMARIFWNRRKAFDLKALTRLVCEELYGYEDNLKAVLTQLKSQHTRAGYPRGYVNYSFLPDDLIGGYAMIDAYVTWLLHIRLYPEMLRKYKELSVREHKVIHIVLDIELRGMPFARRRAKREIKKLDKKMPKLMKKLMRLAGVDFNPNSHLQLKKVLLKQLKVPRAQLLEKGGKGVKLTSNKETLERVANKAESTRTVNFIETLFAVRSINKIVGTYLKPLLRRASFTNGIIYCNLNPTSTRTGRMASNGPNLQNIPRPGTGYDGRSPVRACFICRPGYENYFLDYSQMEMWLFAIMAQEEFMLTQLKAGADIHSSTTVAVYEDEAYDKVNGELKPIFLDGQLLEVMLDSTLRHHCKQVNFAIIYGMQFRSLALFIKKSEVYAYDLRRTYLKTFPRVQAFMDECEVAIKKRGYVQDMFGKRYHISVRDAYKAVNALVQGGCAQVLKIALIKLAHYLEFTAPRYRGMRAQMIILIHDEIVLEMPKGMPVRLKREILSHAKHMMENITQLLAIGIRLRVDIKKSVASWEDKKVYDLFAA